MIDKYESVDNIVYKQMKNALNGNLSHSYLFNTNSNVYSIDMIYNFAVDILSIQSNNTPENIYERCKNSNYEDLIVINSKGTIIKKESIDLLQKNFSRKSLEGLYRVYIIYDVDLLNLSSSNSILKFLEEPDDGIICIMMTNNIDNVLTTIKSRCQIINFKKNNVDELIKFNNIDNNISKYRILYSLGINDLSMYEIYSNYIDKALSFLDYYKKNGVKTIVKNKKYVFDIFDDKLKIKIFINILILFFNDVINYKEINKTNIFDDYLNIVKEYSNKYSLNQLTNKLEVLIKYEHDLIYNLNISLLMDSIIIEMEKI